MVKFGNLRRYLLGLLVVVLQVSRHESVKHERTLCTLLCGQQSQGKKTGHSTVPEYETRSLQGGCGCSQFQRVEKTKRRRSVSDDNLQTKSPQPKSDINTTQTNNTDDISTGKPLTMPDLKGIRIIDSSQELGNVSLKPPDLNDPEIRKLFQSKLRELNKEYERNSYCQFTLPEHVNNTTPRPQPDNIEPRTINVTFTKGSNWSANVTWDSPPADNIPITDFLVLWSATGSTQKMATIEDNYVHCREVPKNKTFTVLCKEDGWVYPQDLHLTVVYLPYYVQTQSRTLRNYSPIENPRMIPVPPLNRETAVGKFKLGSVIGGVVAGVVFIALLSGLLYRRNCGSQESEDPNVRAHFPNINNGDPNVRAHFPNINNGGPKPRNDDIYFASYLPESEEYSNEVAKIIGILGGQGFRVTFDQTDSIEIHNKGFNMWVEKQILKAKKYIIFCSSGYVKLWQALATNTTQDKMSCVDQEDLVRVRYEIKRISDIYSESLSTSRIVCIKMEPKLSTQSLPPWMNHNMLLWPKQKQDILRRLNDQAAMVMDV